MPQKDTEGGKIHIGISGWRYEPWRGVFYPKNLAQRRELEFAANKFDTIELNGSFYSLQRPNSFVQWAAQTPRDFIFSIKGSRYITHMLRLRKVEAPLANFFAQGLLQFGSKLGPILWQLPPTQQFDAHLVDDFLARLPRTFKQAAELARNHDERLVGRSWFDVQKDAPMRHALEVRHPSFVSDAFIRLLRRHHVALVVADTVAWPLLMDITAKFVYCRLHGSKQLYASGYGPKALELWADRVVTWAQGGEVSNGNKASPRDAPRRSGRDVFVYFDNDIKVRAPFDALQLRSRVDRLMRASASQANLHPSAV